MATELQKAMILKIALNEYTSVNGAPPETVEESETWAEMIIESPQDKGVFTSLQNANLVWYGEDGKDSVVGLTDEGLALFKSIHN